MSFVDSLFGVTPELLSHRAKRLEMLSSNLANADTPGYKAVDLDFESIYASQAEARINATGQAEAVRLTTTHASHLNQAGQNASSGVQLDTMYRTPHQYRLDGNTVETDVERMKFMDNAIRYQAGVTFLGNKASSIISTLKGE